MNQNNSTFTDQDRMQDLLSEQKSLLSGYSTFIPEASCQELRQVLMDNFNGCAQNQYTVFEKMSEMGWYPEKQAAQPEVQEARQKFTQLKQQLG